VKICWSAEKDEVGSLFGCASEKG